MPNFIDLAGLRFGRLLVVERSLGQRDTKWLCKCDCGSQKVIGSRALRTGRSTSCGCLHKEQLSSRVKTHGLSESFEYRVWIGMRQRCDNPKSSRHKDYGGRGIKVCDRWQSFEAFLSDMGNAPGDGYSLDRIDNDAGYSPENCRWALATQQARNTRRNHMVTIGDETRCLSEWAARIGINETSLRRRLQRGWQVDRLLMPRTR